MACVQNVTAGTESRKSLPMSGKMRLMERGTGPERRRGKPRLILAHGG